jgi:hypothetical protein
MSDVKPIAEQLTKVYLKIKDKRTKKKTANCRSSWTRLREPYSTTAKNRG